MLQQKLEQNIRQAIDAAIDDQRLVGAHVIVYHQGQKLFSEARGMGDREAGTALDPNGIYRLASITKPMVTAAALRMVEEGTIRLDQPVSTVLPYFTPKLPDGTRPDITVHHLLTHTSGLSYRFFEPEDSPYHSQDICDGEPRQGLTMEANLRNLASIPLKSAPGEKFAYSLSMDVLGEMITKASGAASLEEVIQRYVTEPLGMSDTSFLPKDTDRLVVPYRDGKPPVRMQNDQDNVVDLRGLMTLHFDPGLSWKGYEYYSGGGGMHGSAEDVARFLETIRAGGGPILSQESTDKMFEDQAHSTVANYGPGWSFGYGGAVLVDPAAAGVPLPQGLFSWGGVYGHYWAIDRQHGITMLSLTNTSVEGMCGPFVNELLTALYRSFT